MVIVTGFANVVPCGVVAYIGPKGVTPAGSGGRLAAVVCAIAIAVLVVNAPAGMTTLPPLGSVTVPPAEPIPVLPGGGGGGGLLPPLPSPPSPPPPHAAESANNTTRHARLPHSNKVMIHPGNSPYVLSYDVSGELRTRRRLAAAGTNLSTGTRRDLCALYLLRRGVMIGSR